MNVSTADWNEFAPPPPRGRAPALSLALLAHLLLLAALAWGLNWKRQADTLAVDAELWAAVPTQAAPRAQAPPQPVPKPAPKPAPAPVPKPAPPPPPPVPDTATRDAEIALARQKQQAQEQAARELKERQLREKAQQEAAAKQAAEKKAADKREADKLAAEKKAAEQKLAQEKLEKEKLTREKQVLEAKRQEALKAEAQKKEATAKVQKEKELEALRQDNLKRMTGMANATGAANATGKDLKTAGPSGSYAGKVAARVRPNIVFTDEITSNPTAEVEVHAAVDGTITSRKLVKSSGIKAWDDAVIKAIDKTDKLPVDTDGRVPDDMIISFRPRD